MGNYEPLNGFPEHKEPETALDVTICAVLVLTTVFALVLLFGCATSLHRAKLVPLPLPAHCLVADNFPRPCKQVGGGYVCEKVHLAVRDTVECKTLAGSVAVQK